MFKSKRNGYTLCSNLNSTLTLTAISVEGMKTYIFKNNCHLTVLR